MDEDQLSIVDLAECPQYLEQLARWHHKEWESLNPGRSLPDRINDMQAYLLPRFIPSTFVAIYKGQLAGSAAIVDSDMDTHLELTPWLASVFVRPELRGKGIGGRLVKHVMKVSLQERISTIYLFTPDACGWYQTMGAVLLNDETYHGEEVTLLKFVLSQIEMKE